jgi:hypothetical protein
MSRESRGAMPVVQCQWCSAGAAVPEIRAVLCGEGRGCTTSIAAFVFRGCTTSIAAFVFRR